MKDDQINQFKKARNKMLQRKQELEMQLAQINDALAMSDDAKPVPALRARKPSKPRGYGDLTAAVMAVLANGPMSKREIVERLQAQQFSFAGPPLKIVDSVIYTKHFDRQGKVFSLAKPTAQT